MKPLNIIVYDYETNDRTPFSCQPIQLAAIAIDGRTLEPIGEFNSMIKTIPDEECEKYGLSKTQDDALKVNKKTREEIASAPELKLVWGDFTNFVSQHATGKGHWNAPIVAGFNNVGFDDIITRRIIVGNCQADKKEPYGFGPYDSGTMRCKLFHPLYNLDVANMFYMWMASRYYPPGQNLSLDGVREFLGMSKDGAHDGLVDCRDTGEVLVRLMKLHAAVQVKFENACAKGRLIS